MIFQEIDNARITFYQPQLLDIPVLREREARACCEDM